MLCGGFVSWSTATHLKALGVDPFALSRRRIDRLIIFAGNHTASAALPAPAVALSRRTLDAALIERAEDAGARIERGVAMRAWEEDRIHLADGGEIRAENYVLATGKHEARGAKRIHEDPDPAVGLRWRLGPNPHLERLLAGRIELHLFRDGYAGVVLQEDGYSNVCMAVRRGRLRDAGGEPDRLLRDLAGEAPMLCERLAMAQATGTVQAVANIPYGWIAKAEESPFFRIGDQAGVIPSIAGEGLALATWSGMQAAQAIANGQVPMQFQRSLSQRLRWPIATADAIWKLAEREKIALLLTYLIRMVPATMRVSARFTRIG